MSMSKENSNYEVCFVQVGTDANESTEILRLAFEAMASNLLEPTWVTLEECLKVTKKEPKLYVMDPFEGNVFEHLKAVNCRIVGPLCILYCLQHGDILPKRPHPVYSVSMRKITVSCSNIDNACRENIRHKLELMGGFFSKDLTKSVTHLVVGDVGSKKYQVAANFGLSIMTPDWVEDVWNNGQYQQLHAADSSYNKYKCPVFKGLVITVSQLSVDVRSEIQSIVGENGGSYLAPLKANKTTHLVLSEPTGDKYRHAKNWQIYCVNVKWIYDSVKAGYCKDENLYKIDDASKLTQPKRSTPNRDLTSYDLPLVDCSAITNVSNITQLDETMKSEISVIGRKNSWAPALETFDLSSLPKYGQFLDGCKIFLTGFSSIHLDKLRKIVNAGGGMRFNKFSESISHVVCGDLADDFRQSLRSISVKPYVVNLNWLLECCKNEKLVDEKPFLCMELSLLSPEKEPEIKPIAVSQASMSQSKKEEPVNDNLTDIFKQYVCDENNGFDGSNNDRQSTKESKESSSGFKFNNSETNNDNQQIDVIDLADDETPSSTFQLFSGLKFVIVGFGEKDSGVLAKMVESHSGCVFGNDPNFNADIAIVPIIWQDYLIHAANTVTNCWLQKCIEDSRMYAFDENELFKPIVIPSGNKPFDSFVISVSQYSGTERDCLMHLAEVLGATCQEYFVRKANRSRGILSNTHLIVATPDGSKYEASKKWKIPAVTKHWVLDAAKSGSAPAVERYLVSCCELNEDISCKNAVGKENIIQDDIPKVSTNLPNSIQTRQSLTKSRRDSGKKSAIDSPIINNNVEEQNATMKSKGISPEFAVPVRVTNTSTPHRSIMELHKDNKKEMASPLVSRMDPSFNESLNLDQSYKYKFQVSGLLKDLDASASQDHSFTTSAKRQSLPVEELFGRNLASAIRGVDNKILFSGEGKLDFDKSSFNEMCAPASATSEVLKGVVIYVAKKLANIQNELNETVASLGGDYLYSYDSSCTHLIFTGKANDLSKEFREARSQGKKIVCPDWIYTCKEKNAFVKEDLYPHTLKSNMSLTEEIAIVKCAGVIDATEDENKASEAKPLPQTEDVSVDGNAADFNQQLNDLLVAARSVKRRQLKRHQNSISSSPINEISPIHQLQQKRISDSLIKPVKQEEVCTLDEQDTGSQQSQSYPVVWDDPTGRLEREKIAALTNAQQNNAVETLVANVSYVGGLKRNTCIINADILGHNGVLNEPARTDIGSPEKIKVKKFMFTNIPEPDKVKYIEIIKELSGEVSDEKAFDITSTHLILEKPIKNEKLLSSVASGKWILHPQYLIACQDQKQFVPEDSYEWGGPSTKEFLRNLPASSRKIANCPSRWRIKLNGVTSLKGAFHEWVVLVIADDKAKQSTYTKILEAGGAEVVPMETFSSNIERLTLVIVDMKKRSLSQIDLSPYVSNRIKCVKPEYLAFFLIEDPSPDVENFIIPEVKDLLNSSEQSSKRRNLSITTRGSKRTKLT